MRNYNFIKRYKELLTPDIVALVSQIQELKGKQNAFLEVEADTLTQLVEIAKIQSTEASNKIEGIYTSDERLNLIVRDKTSPQNRSEQEIAGYRDVLNTIHENHEYIFVKPTFVLQLHRDLYKFIGANGGSYKSVDNVMLSSPQASRDISSGTFTPFRFKQEYAPYASRPEAVINAVGRFGI